jgi:Fibronectin type III domain
LSWQTPTDDGGQPIIDYTILTDTDVVVLANITTTNAIITQLTQGVTYKYRVQARNSVGMSQSSNTVAILAAQAPAAP